MVLVLWCRCGGEVGEFDVPPPPTLPPNDNSGGHSDQKSKQQKASYGDDISDIATSQESLGRVVS